MNLNHQHMEKYIRCFPPLINSDSNILILGTIPGDMSLLKEMYYANQKNHFWDFMYRIIEPNHHESVIEISPYKERHYAFLQKNGIALWDIIRECYRTGSSDSTIRQPIYNDLSEILISNVKVIICNGQKAYSYFKKSREFNKFKIPIITLGSTSTKNPINTFQVLSDWNQELRKWII